MRESTNLFKEEQRATDIARRLQESNEYNSLRFSDRAEANVIFCSQLLDILLDINSSSRVAPQLRFDLDSPPLESSITSAKEHDDQSQQAFDSKAASAALEEAQADLASGELSPKAYGQIAAALASKIRPLSLSSLQTIPHSTLGSAATETVPDDISAVTPPGYLTPTHEDDYLFALDSYLGKSSVLPRISLSSSSVRMGEKGFEKEKDVQVRNPVSVYNWLRKHQPQVFLQDNEIISEKSSAKAATSSKTLKRPSLATKADPEIIDEDGFIISESMGSTKSKRKREDEPYRPKGGSSRPAKRRREDGGSGSKKVRRIASAGNGS